MVGHCMVQHEETLKWWTYLNQNKDNMHFCIFIGQILFMYKIMMTFPKRYCCKTHPSWALHGPVWKSSEVMTSYSHILTPQNKIIFSFHIANPVVVRHVHHGLWMVQQSDDKFLSHFNQNKDNMHFSFFIEQILLVYKSCEIS